MGAELHMKIILIWGLDIAVKACIYGPFIIALMKVIVGWLAPVKMAITQCTISFIPAMLKKTWCISNRV